MVVDTQFHKFYGRPFAISICKIEKHVGWDIDFADGIDEVYTLMV